MERSAILIVCNGQPFITHQLRNIYDHVDEIIIVEGADHWFSQIIGSNRSNDGTLEAIKAFPDLDRKIKLIHVNSNKNEMVKEGNRICRGKFIYQVDVDEFMPGEMIDQAFTALESYETVRVPQHWYYKWPDVYLESVKGDTVWFRPARFFHNHWDHGLVVSHIPCAGYYTMDGKWCDRGAVDALTGYARHFLALYRFQLVNKMKYYIARDGVSADTLNKRLSEFDQVVSGTVGMTRIPSYHNARLVREPKAKTFGLPTSWP